MKKCSKCKKDLPLESFGNDKRKKDGKKYCCKSCERILKKEWCVKNRERVNAYGRKKWKRNCVRLKEIVKQHRLSNLEKYRTRDRFYYHTKYKFNKNKNKHKKIWRSLLNVSLKSLGKIKDTNTEKLLGYNSETLKLYIENLWTPGMSWENYGEWHIDHIIPLNKFPKETSPASVNALFNLRPLWAVNKIVDNTYYLGNLNRPKDGSDLLEENWYPIIYEYDIFHDHRGKTCTFDVAGNYPCTFIEHKMSISHKNVLRGLHGDNHTWKLVTCLRGEIFLVVVDCRKNSKTYGKCEQIMLGNSYYKHRAVLIPPKFANGHLCLLDGDNIFYYALSHHYTGPDNQFTIRWDDPDLDIAWPVKENLIMSDRDQNSKMFRELEINI